MAYLTDIASAPFVGVNSLIHIVNTGDTSQNPAGSSYKGTIQDILNLTDPLSITGGTYDPYTGVVTFYNASGGTFQISGFTTGYTDIQVTGYTYDNSNTFTIFETDGTTHSATIDTMTGLTVNGNLTITGNTTLTSTPTTDTSTNTQFLTRDSSTGLIKIKTSPGPVTYGLFSQTGNSTVVSATTSELTIIDGGVGTLTVPANGFSIGDSFNATFGGLLSSKNADTIRIKIKSGAVILADSGLQGLTTSTNDVWNLNLNFTVRKIGSAGVASIVTLGIFQTTKTSNNSQNGFAFNNVNSTTFDTTISNTLDVTAEFSSSSTQNSIFSDVFILNKIY